MGASRLAGWKRFRERIDDMWDYEPVRLCTNDGLVLSANYYAGVSGDPIYVLGHGFTGSANEPRVMTIARQLNEAGASVLALSFRGHGTSGGLSSVGVYETVDVQAAVEWVRGRRPGHAVVLLGFSMGASVMVRYVGQGGDADVVVAVSGPGRWYERSTVPMRRLHFGVETRLGRLLLHRLFNTRIGGGWDLLPVSPVEVAPDITVPVLVVFGDSDPYFGVEHGRMIAAAAPDSELWIEPGMGHAENGVVPELLERIDAWSRLAVRRSATMTA
jgi:predicted alpha/beta-fold hydrolase